MSVIEVLLASVLLMTCALGVIGLVSTSIASNNRNKMDSTQTMLAQSIIEQIHATLIGSGTSALTDCAGTSWTIETAPGGANLDASGAIDFTQTNTPANYYMNYAVNSPCQSVAGQESTYDVRWHIDLVGAPSTPTNTYQITVGARLLHSGPTGLIFSGPVTLKVLAGN